MNPIALALWWKFWRGGFLLALVLLAPAAEARIARSNAARLAFVKANACPATGLHKLPCKNWVIDHKLPLCAGGLDIAKNMQWSERSLSIQKDQEEFAFCRQVRKGLVKKSNDNAVMCEVAKREGWPHMTAALCDGGKK